MPTATVPPVLPYWLGKITAPQISTSRGYVWSTVIIGSRLPEVICRQVGFDAAVSLLPVSQTILLLGLAIVATKLHPTRKLAGFVLAIAALKFGWDVVVPWIEQSSVFQSASEYLSWGGRFFLLRAIRTVGAVFLIVTLIGSGIGRRELFLRLGNWNSPVKPEPFFWFRRPIPWKWFAMTLLLIFGVVLPLYLGFTLQPYIAPMRTLLFVLPWAVATSAVNAANEEFQYRSVLLARLRNVVSPREAVLLTAVLFGVDHYFGQPSGWGGVFMTGVLGWTLAKSMVETRGFSCAFAIHFVQDMVIFVFLASSTTDLTLAWS